MQEGLPAAWREARTRHFVIYSEQSANDLAAYAERLERFDAAVRRVRRMGDPPLTDGAKVTIYVLPSLGALQRLHGGGDSVLGFYKPRAAGSVAFVTNRLEESRNGLSAAHVFQHEYLHHLMLSDIKTPLAAWMIEGFAEFFATAEVGKDGAVRLGYPPKARAYGVLKTAHTVAILGGAKSAWDAAYAFASSGVSVDLIIRKSGRGPGKRAGFT